MLSIKAIHLHYNIIHAGTKVGGLEIFPITNEGLLFCQHFILNHREKSSAIGMGGWAAHIRCISPDGVLKSYVAVHPRKAERLPYSYPKNLRNLFLESKRYFILIRNFNGGFKIVAEDFALQHAHQLLTPLLSA